MIVPREIDSQNFTFSMKIVGYCLLYMMQSLFFSHTFRNGDLFRYVYITVPYFGTCSLAAGTAAIAWIYAAAFQSLRR